MAWRVATSADRALRWVLPAASTSNLGSGGTYGSTDIGKLIQWTSNAGQLLAGSTSNYGRTIAGILQNPNGSSAGSTTPLGILPLGQSDVLEVDFSTASTDATSTNFFPASSNLGYVFAVNGCQSTANGQDAIEAAFIDVTTGRTTLSGSTVGFFVLEGYSTDRRVVTGYIPSSYLL